MSIVLSNQNNSDCRFVIIHEYLRYHYKYVINNLVGV